MDKSEIIVVLCKIMRIEPVLDEDCDYRAAGFIDSLEVVRLVLEIEDYFKIEISIDDLTMPVFRTIGGLATLINKKLQ